MNAKQLRRKILEEAVPIVEHYMATARGEEGPLAKAYGTRSDEKMAEIWKAIVPIVQKESDIVKVQANSTADVISAVCDGKLTIQEARELMSLLREQMEIDVIPDLADKLALLGDRK